MKNGGKTNSHDGHESEIDKNSLHGRYRLPRVFQVVAWLIHEPEFPADPQYEEGYDDTDA